MSSATEPSPWRLEWNEKLSVSIPEIDAEHQNFILLVNKLNEAIVGRKDVEQIKYCMQSILIDAAKHFAHEEALFKQWGYPDAEEHVKKHVQVVNAMNDIMGHFERGGVDYEWIDAGLKVKEALIKHLLNEDMKYRDYLSTLDVPPKAV
jgi:hemerythrin-like metal-binding protein